MPENTFDDKSTSVQVMAWCCQATSHYQSQCWLSSMLAYEVTRPQWVKDFQHLYHFNSPPVWSSSLLWHLPVVNQDLPSAWKEKKYTYISTLGFLGQVISFNLTPSQNVWNFAEILHFNEWKNAFWIKSHNFFSGGLIAKKKIISSNNDFYSIQCHVIDIYTHHQASTRTTRMPAFWEYPRRPMIIHTIDSYKIFKVKAEWHWKYRSRSKVITWNTPSHASDHLYQIWKESIQNCRRYRADTIFKVKAEWHW